MYTFLLTKWVTHWIPLQHTNDNPSILNVIASEYEEFSQYFFVDFTVNCVPVAKDYKTISVRDNKNIDPIKFNNDVKEKAWNIHSTFGQKV